ncbi:uncharacterized protein [Drosophila kikkawai]|uniref:Vegetative cell wall protein gp1-like n=1 Tax=Drosophila kikkawai TaxID=30033 RepID=A0ABM4GQE2_DROKI
MATTPARPQPSQTAQAPADEEKQPPSDQGPPPLVPLQVATTLPRPLPSQATPASANGEKQPPSDQEPPPVAPLRTARVAPVWAHRRFGPLRMATTPPGPRPSQTAQAPADEEKQLAWDQGPPPLVPLRVTTTLPRPLPYQATQAPANGEKQPPSDQEPPPLAPLRAAVEGFEQMANETGINHRRRPLLDESATMAEDHSTARSLPRRSSDRAPDTLRCSRGVTGSST